jgi:hypothetical protein
MKKVSATLAEEPAFRWLLDLLGAEIAMHDHGLVDPTHFPWFSVGGAIWLRSTVAGVFPSPRYSRNNITNRTPKCRRDGTQPNSQKRAPLKQSRIHVGEHWGLRGKTRRYQNAGRETDYGCNEVRAMIALTSACATCPSLAAVLPRTPQTESSSPQDRSGPRAPESAVPDDKSSATSAR